MKIEMRIELLEKIYRVYEAFCAGFPSACRKGCALCCTANVTMTTLEGIMIHNHWLAEGSIAPVAALQAAARRPRFQPRITTNHLAALCVQPQEGDPELPDESADPRVGPCPLLEENLCSIYAVRPFGCRAMVSLSDCAAHDAAEMPDEVLAANTLVLQFIEAIDEGGVMGNLTDVLLLLAQVERPDAYERKDRQPSANGLAANQPIPCLMVPPEQRERVAPLLQAIRRILTAP